MARPTDHATQPTGDIGFESLFALATLLAENVLRLQQLQLESWLSWQKTLAASGEEFMDEWTCRFAGGVPIDG